MTQWTFTAELWDWDASDATWTFLATPPDVDEEIRMTAGPPRGFGSVRVEATIGGSTWRTSVFPSNEHGFVLPVKKAVRRREDVEAGDLAEVTLRLLEE
ncbi:MAG TPA: DUF1905 domain-containing protein [Marmoricola sp.]|jgi:hypothetical protein|nr:DUF1905 domain-containing protein [Marmoricola sp.]